MSYTRTAFGGIIWQFMQISGERILQAATFLILARLIGPNEFGVAAISLAAVNIFCGFLQGSAQHLVAKPELSPRQLSSFFWLVILLCIAFLTLNVVATIGIMGDRWLLLSTVASLAPLVATVAIMPDVLLARSLNYRALAMRRIAGVALSNVLSILLALFDAGAWSLIFQLVSSYVISGTVSAVVTRWRPQFMCSFSDWRAIWRGAMLSGLSSGVVQANGRIVEFLVGVLVDAQAAGVFRVARTIVDLSTSFAVNPICTILVTMLDKLRRDARNVEKIVADVFFLAFMIGCLGALLCRGLLPPIITIWFGQSWAGLPAVMAIMALAIPSLSLLLLTVSLSVGMQRSEIGLLGTISFVIVGMASVTLTHRWGMAWIAIGVVTASYLSAFSLLWFSLQTMRFQPNRIVPPIAVLFALGAAMIAIESAVGLQGSNSDHPLVSLTVALSVVFTFVLGTRALVPKSLKAVIDRINFSTKLHRAVGLILLYPR